MRKLKHREIQRRLDGVLARLNGVAPEIQTVCLRANTDMDDGVSGIDYGRKLRRSGPADPVGARPDRVDSVAAAATVFYSALAGLEREAARMDKAAWALMALSPEQARVLSEKDEVAHHPEEQTLSATCSNPACRRPVARTANDRLREGRCENCYRYRHTHGVERPKLLCDAERNIGEAFGLDEERLIVDGAA